MASGQISHLILVAEMMGIALPGQYIEMTVQCEFMQ